MRLRRSARPTSPGARAAAAAVVCLGLFMLGMDLTVLNVALPGLQHDLEASSAEVQWIVDAYALVLGGTVLAVGAFTDSWGRRRSFVCGMAVCAAASVCGAFAAQPWQAVGARCLLGAGAALLMPATLAVLHDLFPEPVLRRRAIAAWAAVGGLGGVCGPVIGGWLVEQSSWRAGFWVNLPPAVLAIGLALVLVPESRSPRPSAFDAPGAALSIVGLTALVWAVIESPHRGWTSGWVVGVFACSLVLLAAFLLRQSRARAPMLPLSVLAAPRVSMGAGALAVVAFAAFGSLFVLTLYLQGVLGYSPLEAGVRTLPLPAGLAVGAAVSLPLQARRGQKTPIVLGLAVVSLSFVVLAGTSAGSGYGRCALFQLVIGVGSGLVGAAATESVMAAVPEQKTGLGSAVNDATRQIGSALGVAVQGAIVTGVFTSRLHASLDQHDASGELLAAADLSMLAVPGAAARLGPLAREATLAAAREAFADALTVTAVVAGTVTLVMSVAAARWLPRPVEHQHEDASARQGGGGELPGCAVGVGR